MLSEKQKEAIKKHMLVEEIDQSVGQTKQRFYNYVCLFCKLAQALNIRTPAGDYDYQWSHRNQPYEQVLCKALRRFYLENEQEPEETVELDSEYYHYEEFYEQYLLGPENQGNWDKIFSYMELRK